MNRTEDTPLDEWIWKRDAGMVTDDQFVAFVKSSTYGELLTVQEETLVGPGEEIWTRN
jgi:hypothetical protein